MNVALQEVKRTFCATMFSLDVGLGVEDMVKGERVYCGRQLRSSATVLVNVPRRCHKDRSSPSDHVFSHENAIGKSTDTSNSFILTLYED